MSGYAVLFNYSNWSSAVSSQDRKLPNHEKRNEEQKLHVSIYKQVNGTAIPLQAWTGPEGSRRLRLPDCKTIGT